MKKIKLCYLFLLLTFSYGVHAQGVIKGTVKSTTGEALVGASVLIKGTTKGAVADIDGNFQLEIDEAAKSSALVVSFIGYVAQELPIGDRTTFNITLAEDLTQLSEIVITGYTAQSKEKITGAITSVEADLITKLPVPNIDQALQGRAPGVVVSQNTGAPGEGVSVRIRGVGSFTSGNSPLYIIDGIPTQDMSGFSTQDIENISILKDASAAAVYGARATNGVVIITTKSGRSSRQQIQINSQYGIQQPSRLIDMTNTADYVSIYNEAATNDNANKTNPIFFRKLITDDIKSTLPDVDYIDAIMHEGVLQSHSISFSGGENKTQYFISANYFDQEGIIKSSDFNRVSGRMNISSQVKDWLRTGANLNISKSKTNLIGSSGDGAGGNGGSVIRYAFFRTPAIPIYDSQGNFTDKPERFDLFGDGYSPVGMLAYNNNEKTNNQVFTKVFFEITPVKDVTYTSNIGIDLNYENQRRFDRNWGTGDRINNPNQLSVWANRYQVLTFSNFLTYEKAFDQHQFTILLGTEGIKKSRYSIFSNERNFSDQDPDLVYLGNGQGLKNSAEGRAGSALLSFFAKVDYDLNGGKYIASVTGRRDGSSRFGPERRWGTFYAASLGWRLDQEAFLQNSKFIDKLFLRAGYGSIGNQEIDDYGFINTISVGYNYPFGDVKGNGYAINQLGNTRIQWESSNQMNVGLDVGVIGGKLALSIDYFNKITDKLLNRQPLPSSVGNALPPYVNNGKMVNRGIEVIVKYADTFRDFNYSIEANAATLHNEVLDVYAPVASGKIGSDYITRTEIGQPVGSFYLFEMEGIFQDDAQIFTHALQGSKIAPGDVMYKDQDGNGIIDGNDRIHAGSSIPKLTAGLNVSLGYKNFDLSLFFQGAYGHKVFSVLNRDIEGFYRPFNVTQRYFDNHWTGPGTSNEYPRASWDASGNNTKYSTRFLEDASYTRLKNLQLGYTIPAATIERLKISSIRIYFSGTNLLTFTRYSGMDPEMTTSDNARGTGDLALGMDWGTYPSAKSYNLGVNLIF